MKLSTVGRSGLLAVAMVLVGCSQPDEPQPVAPTSGSTASSSAGTELPTAAGSASAEASSAGGSTAEATPSVAVPSEAVPSEAVPSEAAPSEAQPPAASAAPPPASSSRTPLPSPVPAPVPTQAPPAASFPDPSEVEAQGFATNPLCEVLSVDEVGTLLGAPVRPAVDAADGTGCLWTGTAAASSFLQLQMVGDPARYVQPAGAESLSGIGDVAAVVRDATGWTAQAQNLDGAFAVQLAGPTAGRDGAVEALRRLLERY